MQIPCHLHYPRAYREEEVDQLMGAYQEACTNWAGQTHQEIIEFFKKHPTEKTAIRLEMAHTSFQINEEAVDVLLLMRCYRKNESVEFICFLGSAERLHAEVARIIQEAQDKTKGPGIRLTMIEEHLGA
jgi:hypothetical protein